MTPFVGVRLDAATLRRRERPAPPGEVSLLTATPIAALDVRWPLIAINGGHLAPVRADRADRLSRPATRPTARHHQRQRAELRLRRHQPLLLQPLLRHRPAGDRASAPISAAATRPISPTAAGSSCSPASPSSSPAPTPRHRRPDADRRSHTGLGDRRVLRRARRARRGHRRPQGGAKVQIDPNPTPPLIRRAGVGAPGGGTPSASPRGRLHLHRPPIRCSASSPTSTRSTAGVGVPIADYWTANGGAGLGPRQQHLARGRRGLLYDDGYLVVRR